MNSVMAMKVFSKLPVSTETKVKGAKLYIEKKLEGIPNFGRYLFILGIIIGIITLICGILAVLKLLGASRWYIGIYLIPFGPLLFAFEFPFPFWKKIPFLGILWSNYLFRSILYFILAIPCYAVNIGILAGGFITILSILYFISWLKGESALNDSMEYEQLKEQFVNKFIQEEEQHPIESESD
ncbi:hypothetical protein ABK040_007300 [Willaertia magna]